jgi:flagellar biosynthetic protein FlhB
MTLLAMLTSNDRTEKPTPKRRAEARRKGQAARSVELPQAISLFVAALMLPVTMPRFLTRSAEQWRGALGANSIREPGPALAMLGEMVQVAVSTFLPVIAVVAATSVIAQLALAGTRPNFHKVKPQWKALNPGAALRRIFSLRSLWELVKTALKLAALAAVTYGVLRAGMASLMTGPRDLAASVAVLGSSLKAILLRVAALGLVIGLVDAAVARRRFDRSLRMTKQEVKEEHRQSEGDPVVKSEIRRRQAKLSRNRMIAAVSKADVVVTNPTHLAVALQYESTDAAPRVVAKGAGTVATRIREEARKHGVPVQENKPLARTLFRSVEVGDLIPAELYAVVAEILAVVYRARRRL